jgi:hypothetical protein
MNNNSHNLVRNHLKMYLNDVQITKDQIKNIAKQYDVSVASLHSLPRDLVRQKFLIKSGNGFRVSGWVANLY